MLWLINPPKKRRKTKGRIMATRKRKATKKRPSAKQLAARKKFTAMVRARAAAGRSTRTRGRKPVAARKRVRRVRRRKTGVMASVKRGGRPVSRSSWSASGYRRNPRRRKRAVSHRRRSYRRNPSVGGIGRQVLELGKQTIAVMAGRTLGRTISNLIPFGGTSPLMSAGKGVAVAILIKMVGGKTRFLSADLVNALAVGAMLAPVSDLVTAYAPGALPYLSGGPMGMPSFVGTYAPRVGAYTNLTASDGMGSDDSSFIGSYAPEVYN